MKKLAAIYKITFNCEAPNVYYGSTNHVSRRKSQHLYSLRRSSHSNPILQAYFNKYGESSLNFEVVESIITQDNEYIREREQAYLDTIFSNPPKGVKILNINKDATNPYIEWSEERKEALRVLNRTRVWTKAQKEHMANLKRGIKYSKATNIKKSKSLKKTLYVCKRQS